MRVRQLSENPGRKMGFIKNKILMIFITHIWIKVNIKYIKIPAF